MAEPAEQHELGDVDPGALVSSGGRVADLVAAVQRSDAAAMLSAMQDDASARQAAAAVSATAALAARLPALSGVTGPAAFADDDEDPAELLQAYASVLAARSEAQRLQLAPVVTREQLVDVARTAAAGAHRLLEDAGEAPSSSGTAAGDLAHWRSRDLPASTQLVAACLLLAQTARDGGGSTADIEREIEDLFA